MLLAGTVRAEFRPDGSLDELFNSLAGVDSGGELVAVYDSHLVPFGEYMPASGLLPVRLAAGGIDFSAGPGPVLLRIPGLPSFGALICYEVIFPGAVAPSPRPDWLVNITNDAWFGVSAGPFQHLAAARLRAVEEGLPLARAAQTGISAVFDGTGRLVGRLPLGVVGSIGTRLPNPLPPTFFARFGLALPLALVAASLAGATILRRNRFTSLAREQGPVRIFIEKSQKY